MWRGAFIISIYALGFMAPNAASQYIDIGEILAMGSQIIGDMSQVLQSLQADGEGSVEARTFWRPKFDLQKMLDKAKRATDALNAGIDAYEASKGNESDEEGTETSDGDGNAEARNFIKKKGKPWYSSIPAIVDTTHKGGEILTTGLNFWDRITGNGPPSPGQVPNTLLGASNIVEQFEDAPPVEDLTTNEEGISNEEGSVEARRFLQENGPPGGVEGRAVPFTTPPKTRAPGS